MPLKGVYRAGVVGKNVGKKIANSKKMIKWGLLMDNKKYVVMLKHTILNGKKALFVNNELIHEEQQMFAGSNYEYEWKIEQRSCQVVISKDDDGYSYDLLIDGEHFFDLDDIADLKEKEEAEKKKPAAKKVAKKTASPKEDEEEEKEKPKKKVVKKVVKKPAPISSGANFLGISFEDGDEDEDDFFAAGGTLEDQLAGLDFSVENYAEPESPETPKTPVEEKKKKVQAAKFSLGGLVDLDDISGSDKKEEVKEDRKVHITKKITPAANFSLDDIKKLNQGAAAQPQKNTFDPFAF
ncbi:hypothetical protein WA158_006810 [Blastocystis sp. Blastoise]